MPRQARLDSPGTLHHVIVRGIERQKIISDEEDRKAFVFRLGRVASETATGIYAWVLMTNHAHILLRSGPEGLAKFMRRFLTGYAISYNLRHRRHGHLFQNRYKSIVCDEDSYLLELVRYIHLNPLRAKLVQTLEALDRYPYCGHSVLMGKVKHKWQDRDYVLYKFGSKEGEAKRRYRGFVQAGIEDGHRPELVGGGLVRTLGGWSEVVSLRRKGMRELTDARILGSGTFVEHLLEEADERTRQRFSAADCHRIIEDLIVSTCLEEKIYPAALKGGSRRGNMPAIRLKIAMKLVEEHGVAMAEAARSLGVSTSAISKALKRSKST